MHTGGSCQSACSSSGSRCKRIAEARRRRTVSSSVHKFVPNFLSMRSCMQETERSQSKVRVGATGTQARRRSEGSRRCGGVFSLHLCDHAWVLRFVLYVCMLCIWFWFFLFICYNVLSQYRNKQRKNKAMVMWWARLIGRLFSQGKKEASY